jgi:DNA-binding IclR family transcriptional regulator
VPDTTTMPCPAELNTGDRVLLLIQASPNGITLRELCQQLNRSVSMVQRYLKLFIRQGKISSQLSANGMHLVFKVYP